MVSAACFCFVRLGLAKMGGFFCFVWAYGGISQLDE